jgi:DNA-directed RNA polymerase subunit RPC12/RpoP
MSVANCPSCGAPVEFAIGSSAVVVCTYCSSVVARTDRGLELHGKVAALIDTGTPLRTGLAGKYRGNGYRITGRSQLRHQAGGVWNEWYAAFDDGRWGWLAEAQGRFYVTFKVAEEAPPLESVGLGQQVNNLTVSEIGEAELLSAEGELPWVPEPGYSYSYADLTGTEGRFATIDYSATPPVVFKGHEVALADLGLEEINLRRERVKATALNCSKCGGPLNLIAPDQAERIWCPNCGAGHDVTEGELAYFATLKKKKIAPVIPLGSRGTIDGDEYVVAGFMERAVKFDRDYFWTEYLLYNPQRSYRWLVHSDDHWSFVTPLRAGEVSESAVLGGGTGKWLNYNGRRYRLFQDATARVTYVLGEFYWKVAVGEAVDTADYVAPPYGASKEVTKSGAQEVNYSHAVYMTPKEVQTAFRLEKKLPRPSTVGSMQPFPGPHFVKPFLILFLLLVVMAMVVSVTRPRRTLLDRTFDLAAMPTEQAAPGQTFFTEPVTVSGDGNIVIEGFANVDNDWLYVEGDFVNTLTNALSEFSLPLEYYHGVDQGERWSEGRKSRRIYLSSPEKGSYVLRLAAQWEQGKTPPNFTLRVREGVFRWPHFIVAFLVLCIPPFLAFIRYVHFESERWKESSHSPYAALQEMSGDDEDEEE